MRSVAFLLVPMVLFAVSAHAEEIRITQDQDVITVGFKSKASEDGDGEALFNAISGGNLRNRMLRGDAFVLSCGIKTERCPGCTFYVCQASIRVSDDAIFQGKYLEQALSLRDARRLFLLLKLPEQKELRNGMRVIRKSFVTTDKKTLSIYVAQAELTDPPRAEFSGLLVINGN